MSQQVPPHDPRPLPGEPLSLDLLNTRWNDGGSPRDLLDSLAGLATWLKFNGLTDRAAADRATLDAVHAARTAIAGLVDAGTAPRRAPPSTPSSRTARSAARSARTARSTRSAPTIPPGCRPGAPPPTTCACSPRRPAGSAPARTRTASCTSTTSRRTAPAAGARWPPAATARRRHGTTPAAGPPDSPVKDVLIRPF